MKNTRRPSPAQSLIGLVQLRRIRLSVAENVLESAEELSRLARQRRKEAKLTARRAKKQLKRARSDVAEARQALAEAETRLARNAARGEAKQGRLARARSRRTSAGRRTKTGTLR